MRTPHAARFTAVHRLHHKPEFDLIYREGRRYVDNSFLALACANALMHPRLGLSIAAKTVGNAVNRNRIKRIIRESFRLNMHRIPAVDVVINARMGARTAASAVLMQSLEQLWDKLARHA